MDSCIWCNSPSNGLRCSSCKVVVYCSAECQKQHWASGHKGQCRALSTNNQEYIESSTAKADDFKFPTRYLFPPKRVVQMLDFKQNLPVGAGLRNYGNTCFMNVVLQCMVYTPGFVNYLISRDHTQSCVIAKEGGFCMTCLMEQHCHLVLCNPGEVVGPRDIFINLKNILPLTLEYNLRFDSSTKIGDFQLLTEEDSHEFYDQVLDRLHTSFLKNSAGKEKVDPLTEGTTLMRQLYGGYLQNQVQCCECKSVSRTYEPFTTLPIHINPASTSVEQALLGFTSIEHMPEDIGYRCAKCDKKVAADKQLLVRIAPPILTLSLKRFDFTLGGKKIDKSLIFHNELLLDSIYPKEYQNENENYKYSLYALVVHFGQSVYYGHYVAFVKIHERWYLFDDQKVNEVSPAVVLKQKAYMLFYKREKMDPSQRQLLNQQFQRSATTAPLRKSNNPEVDVSGLRISSPPTPAAAPTLPNSPVTPNFKIFYRNPADNSEDIMDLVLRVHLPLLTTPEKIFMSAGAQGAMKLLVPSLYFLDVSIPFTLDTDNSKGYFFCKNGFLFVVFPIAHDTSKVKPSNTVKILAVQKEEESPVDLQVSSEHEIEAIPNKMAVTKKPEDAKKEPSKDERQDETTYAGLYQHVKDWQSEKEKRKDEVDKRAPGKEPKQQKAKAGRNQTCPCGSGRKYKVCHGQ